MLLKESTLVIEQFGVFIKEEKGQEGQFSEKRSLEASGVTGGKWRHIKQLGVSIATKHYRMGDG